MYFTLKNSKYLTSAGIVLNPDEYCLQKQLQESVDDISSRRDFVLVTSTLKRERTVQKMIALAVPLPAASELNLHFIICGFREAEASIHRQTYLKEVYYGTLAKLIYSTRTTIKGLLNSGDVDKIGQKPKESLTETEIEHMENRLIDAEHSNLFPKLTMKGLYREEAVMNAARIVHDFYEQANSRANFFDLVERKIKKVRMHKSLYLPIHGIRAPDEY